VLEEAGIELFFFIIYFFFFCKTYRQKMHCITLSLNKYQTI